MAVKLSLSQPDPSQVISWGGPPGPPHCRGDDKAVAEVEAHFKRGLNVGSIMEPATLKRDTGYAGCDWPLLAPTLAPPPSPPPFLPAHKGGRCCNISQGL